jgi:hypothetical protein
MQVIPKPELLDPDRALRELGPRVTVDHRSRAEVLDVALHDSCAYAEQLWNTLNRVREYLLDSLPGNPDAAGEIRRSASPIGPDDDAGWSQWCDAFAAVSSILSGAGGDSGFGRERAHEEERDRRRVTGA